MFFNQVRFIFTWNKNQIFLMCKISNFCSNFAKIFCWKLQGQIFFVHLLDQDFVFLWNHEMLPDVQLEFLVSVKYYLFSCSKFWISNLYKITHIWQVAFPVIFCQMVLWFQIRIIFFSCCPILNISCSDGHLRFQIHTKIDIFLVNHHMVIHVQFRFN